MVFSLQNKGKREFPFIEATEGIVGSGYIRVMENWESHGFVSSIVRPGKSCNLSEGHGKSWKSNTLGKKMF